MVKVGGADIGFRVFFFLDRAAKQGTRKVEVKRQFCIYRIVAVCWSYKWSCSILMKAGEHFEKKKFIRSKCHSQLCLSYLPIVD